MASDKAKPAKEQEPTPASVQSDEPMTFKVGPFSLVEIEPGETHSDIGLDCESGIPWASQHLSRFHVYFNTREDGKAAVAFSLSNPLVDELKTALTLLAQESAAHPPE
jgi:hypothetical protein